MPKDKFPTRLEILHAQRSHLGIKKFMDFLTDGEQSASFISMSEEERSAFGLDVTKFELAHDGLILRKAAASLEQPRIWLPPALFRQIFRAYHDRLGHHGVAKTEALVLERYSSGVSDEHLRAQLREHISTVQCAGGAKVAR